MQIIGLILVGLVIGALARLLLPGRQKIGLLWTMVLGVLGAVIGGTIASAINVGSIFELNFLGFVIAVVASVALLAVGQSMGLGAPPRDRVGPTGRGGRLGR